MNIIETAHHLVEVVGRRRLLIGGSTEDGSHSPEVEPSQEPLGIPVHISRAHLRHGVECHPAIAVQQTLFETARHAAAHSGPPRPATGARQVRSKVAMMNRIMIGSLALVWFWVTR